MAMATGFSQDWAEDFRVWLHRKGSSSKTVKAYLQGVSEYAGWFEQARGETFTPEHLNGFDLVRYQEWVTGVAGKKPATWNLRLAALKKLQKWAGKQATLPGDLFEDVRKADPGELPPDWLTDAEFGRLGSYLHATGFDVRDNTALRQYLATRNRALMVVLLYGGLREFEAAALELGDLALSERSGRITVRHGKGGLRREVPLGDARARAVLRRWLQMRGPGAGFVFQGEGGESLSERMIQEIAHEIGERCKIGDLRPHRLRHTFVRRLLEAGVRIEVAAKLAGHRSIESTKRYGQPGREDLERATALIAQGAMAKQPKGGG